MHTRRHFKANIRIDSHCHSCCSWNVNMRFFQPPTNTQEKNSVALKQIVYLLGCSCCLGHINSEERLRYNPVFQLHFDTWHIDQSYTWHVYTNCLVTILRHKTSHKNPKYHYVCNWRFHLLAECQFCVNFVEKTLEVLSSNTFVLEQVEGCYILNIMGITRFEIDALCKRVIK